MFLGYPRSGSVGSKKTTGLWEANTAGLRKRRLNSRFVTANRIDLSHLLIH